jgi:hypothetical protein
VIVLPPAQFLRRYAFFTDPTYATTNLVVTRVKSNDEFKPVTDRLPRRARRLEAGR